MPAEIRDLWLEDGGSLKLLTDLCENVAGVGKVIIAAGLVHVIDPARFGASLRFAWDLSMRRLAHHRIKEIDNFIRPLTAVRVGDLRLLPPANVIDHLPCAVHDDFSVEVLLSAETWSDILQHAASRASTPNRFSALVQAGVYAALKTAGIDLGEVYGPEVLDALAIINAAPAFIRDADFLDLAERMSLATATADAPEEIVLAAKQMACDYFGGDMHSEGGDGAARAPAAALGRTVVEVFEELFAPP